MFDPTLPQPEPGEVYQVEQLLSRLRREGAELVDEYAWWAMRYPATTEALVKAGRAREEAEIRALKAFLRADQRKVTS